MFDVDNDDMKIAKFMRILVKGMWRSAADMARTGRKLFIQGVRRSMKAKNPAEKFAARSLKQQGRKMVGRVMRREVEGADMECGSKHKKKKPGFISRMMEGAEYEAGDAGMSTAGKRKAKRILGNKAFKSLDRYKKATEMKPRRTQARRERRMARSIRNKNRREREKG